MIIDVNAINKIDMTDFPFSSNPERYLFLAKKDKTGFGRRSNRDFGQWDIFQTPQIRRVLQQIFCFFGLTNRKCKNIVTCALS